MRKARAARTRYLVALVLGTLTLFCASSATAQSAPATPATPAVVSVDASAYPDVSIDVIVPGAKNTLDKTAFETSAGRVASATRLPADALDVVVIIDDRRSIGAVGFANLKEVAAQLIGDLTAGTHVAVSTVSGLGGLPTADLAGAAQFTRQLTSVPAAADRTPGSALVRIGGLLKPGAGRRTHVVVLAGDAAPLAPTDGAAIGALLTKADADLSIITVASQLDPSATEAVTPGGVATAADGRGVTTLGAAATSALTERYRVQIGATTAGAQTLTVRTPEGTSAPVRFTLDQPRPGPTSATPTTAAPTATSATSATTSAVVTTAPAAPVATPTTAAGTTATTNPTPATATATATTVAAVDGATPRRSRRGLIGLLAVVGVLAGAAVAYVAVRRFARRQQPSAWIEFDSLRVSTQRDDAFRASRELRLDPNERAVLLALVRRPGHIFSREDVAAIAWPERTDVSPRLVSTLMDHLQRTVDGFDDAPLVHAVRGAGYVLSDPADTDDDIATAVKPRPPQYAPQPHRRASRR